MALRAQTGATKPLCGKFISAVSHILAAEYAHLKHLFRRQLRQKIFVEVFSDGLCQQVRVARLHQVVDLYGLEHWTAFTVSGEYLLPCLALRLREWSAWPGGTVERQCAEEGVEGLFLGDFDKP